MSALKMTSVSATYATNHGPVQALDDVTFHVQPGEVVGVVGESGSGKSTLGSAIGYLLPRNAVITGSVTVAGESVGAMNRSELQALRQDTLGFVPQSPHTSMDPTMRVGRQLGLLIDEPAMSPVTAAHLERVGLPDPERVARLYPHQMSGGMAQRAAIALALVHDPSLIVADEPTASLDSTVRAVVLQMLLDRVRSSGATLLLLSHDLGAVRSHCDRVVVMYGGRIVEDGRADDVLREPEHPYTRALLKAMLGREEIGEKLEPIEGSPPILQGPAPGCAFAPRCRHKSQACDDHKPQLALIRGSHLVSCHERTGR